MAGPIVEFDGNIGLVIGAGGGSLTTFDAVTQTRRQARQLLRRSAATRACARRSG